MSVCCPNDCLAYDLNEEEGFGFVFSVFHGLNLLKRDLKGSSRDGVEVQPVVGLTVNGVVDALLYLAGVVVRTSN